MAKDGAGAAPYNVPRTSARFGMHGCEGMLLLLSLPAVYVTTVVDLLCMHIRLWWTATFFLPVLQRSPSLFLPFLPLTYDYTLWQQLVLHLWSLSSTAFSFVYFWIMCMTKNNDVLLATTEQAKEHFGYKGLLKNSFVTRFVYPNSVKWEWGW